jgi:hypothetical protein
MIRQTAAVVAVRDDRGRGFACAKAAAAATSRSVGTSVIARTPNACVWFGAGRRRGGRPGGARTMRLRPSMPRHNVRAVSAPPPRRNHRRCPKLRRRVVTQRKFFRRLLCATGPDAMNHRRSRAATRHAIAAPPAVRRFAGCSIANASGCGAARSKAAAYATGSARPPARGTAPSFHDTASATSPRAPPLRPGPAAAPVRRRWPRLASSVAWDRVFGFDPVLAQQESQA